MIYIHFNKNNKQHPINQVYRISNKSLKFTTIRYERNIFKL